MVTEDRRRNLNDFSKRELNSILMTILVGFFHAIGKGSHSIRPIFYLNHLDDISYNTYLLNTNIITWLCQSMNLVLFLLFNQEFRQKFQIIFLRKNTNINPSANALALNIATAQTAQN